ncbi:MAG: SpoVA/SpoVAEb family sporulation membrane protein [Oscillospiraceae bacterium]|nr:SpoVA/SpoVAEb family sporulation membrane protein [Oscillospiraceae bacterium]
MQMTNAQYAKLVEKRAPKSKTALNVMKAFFIGGAICVVGQLIRGFWLMLADEIAAGTLTSVTLVGLGALLTALGVYDKIAKHAGAGTLVPITGFSNAICAPALEFRTEGLITGTAVKMFSIAGPVIVYGTLASVAYGVVLWLIGLTR